SSKPQTLDELQTLVAEGIEYFTNTFISAKRNDVKGGFKLSFYSGLKMYDLVGLRIDRCQAI
ncbi:hypothetical protein LMB73_01285, partial [Limosilactobacillus reuteri]|nr:hypothetical protein [Limosilactobacillus reuteri]MCC4464263.1 hypothetical protein [Limosilactobacillus reuteri]